MNDAYWEREWRTQGDGPEGFGFFVFFIIVVGIIIYAT